MKEGICMEMKLTYREMPCWQEQTSADKYPITMEAVVPDSREDAVRVIWAGSYVLLKGKEPGAHSCSFLGEANASVLYQTETGELAVLRLRKEFSWSTETGSTDAEALPQITWWPAAVEARLLNPRKVAVSIELHGVIRSFTRGSIPVAPEPIPKQGRGLHFLTREDPCLLLREVKEKPFTLREQLPMQEEVPSPVNIEGEEVRFLALESEQLGERTVIKGEAELRVWGLNGEGLPVSCSFRIPFSQLMELGERNLSQKEISIQASSLYLDRREGMDGEYSLDAEIHAVLQLRAYEALTLETVQDAYSTRMPCVPQTAQGSMLRSVECEKLSLLADESLAMPEDVLELLAWKTILGPLERNREGCGQTVNFQMLVRKKDGRLDGISRSARLVGDPVAETLICGESILHSCSPELREGKLHLRAAASITGELAVSESRKLVTALTLDEEHAWDPAELPSVSLVRRGEESLWDLAKAYRSSVETILAYNGKESDMLLIPAL